MKKIFLILAATAFLALPALAMTPSEVQGEATALLASYQGLQVGVAACPDGGCSGAESLIDQYAALEAQRAILHADRLSLGSCNYGQIDNLIAQLDQLSGVLSATLGGWDQEE